MSMKSLRSLFAMLVIPLVLSMGLGLSASAIAADDQNSQQQAGKTSEADLWRAVKAGESGFTTAQGIEPGVLINVVGNQGKDVRNQYLTPVMAITVVGVFVAFLFFYLVNGPSKLSKGFSGKMVLRWTKADLWIHWLMASSCMVLIFTGLNIMLGKYVLQPYIGEGFWAALIYGSKTIHD